ncbi:hypothetical protein HPB52_013453 [Rhipicephalus sanguineus]|uniref:Uncharacterized protein n=1 Tax=Rhipicephalus sanguineus TaxID=34632 RepID=A0A9D4PJL0_RHISA|nr:hypothetical protein HPB52_013453 [Rhipicephalus sanguineus]
MEDLLQPFRVGQDIALFLVNFERTCEKAGFPLESWPQELLTLLPCEAADVIARLNRKDAVTYDKVKEALLRKCRLSAKAFRQRLSHARKARTSDEGTHGGRGKMANRHAECLGRGKGSVLALVSDGLQVVTEVKNTLFSHCGSVGSAEWKGQIEECLEREEGSVLTPTSDSWQQLTEVDKDIESKRRQEEHRRKKQALEHEAQQKRSLTSVDVEHKGCDVAAVPLTAEEKASAGEGIAETLTRSKERELAATSGCEGSVEKRSTKSKPYSTTDDSKEGAPAKEGVGSSEGSRVNRGAECTGELLDVSPAVRIAENERDPTLRDQGPQGLTEELSGGDNAVTNSSFVRERPCKDVSSGIGLEKVELSASLATEREDELLGNQDSAREEAGERFNDVDECQRRTKGSKGGTKKSAKRRKRPKDKNAAEIAMRLKKGFKRRNKKARKVPLSSLTGLYRMRPRGQKEKKCAAHCTRNLSEDELMRNHQDSKRETAEEHVNADEHRRRTECSKVCTKKRAKGRKRPKDRNATKVATRLRKKFKSRREIARQVRLPSGTGFYRMHPYRRKKKKREAHDSRKGSVGKRTPRCSFRGTLKQVRHREVGDLREVAGGDKEKSATGKVVRLDEGVINFHAYRTPRLTRKAFWARPPRVRLKSC